MRPSREVWFVAALTVAGAALRFATLDVQSFWLDEVVTADLVDRSLGGMLSAIPDSESTPPLYYILAWGWTKLFGDAEVGLRSFSALVGTATIPVVWAAARSLTTPRIGVVVAALAATNPLLVHYSQEARSYALLVLLGAVALLFFARLLENGGSRAALVGWALAAALALATHYYAVFLVAPQAVWLIATLRPRTPAVVATLAVGVVGGALLPVGIHQKKLDLASFIADTPFLERLGRLPKHFLIAYQGPAEVVLAAVSIALVVLGVALLLARGEGAERRGAAIAGALGGAAIVVPAVLVAVGIDYFDTRNLIVAWLPLAIVAGAGFGARRAGAAGIVSAVALCAVFLATVIGVALEPRYQREDWRGVARALGPAPVGGRAILVTPASGRIPLAHYLPGRTAFVPPADGTVIQVALVSVGGADTGRSGSADPPRPEAVPSPVLGTVFESLRRYAESFSLVVFDAGGLFPINAQAPPGSTLEPGRDRSVLIQR